MNRRRQQARLTKFENGLKGREREGGQNIAEIILVEEKYPAYMLSMEGQAKRLSFRSLACKIFWYVRTKTKSDQYFYILMCE